jgi:hypothetical protein
MANFNAYFCSDSMISSLILLNICSNLMDIPSAF